MWARAVRIVLCATVALALAPGGAAAQQRTPTGPMVAEIGFNPVSDGFSFRNYGPGKYPEATPVEMRRMFGDAVCGGSPTTDGGCPLTPPAKQWLDTKSPPGGHCYGMAMLSLRLFAREISITPFGGPFPFVLEIGTPESPNVPLSREIAFSHMAQYFDTVKARRVTGTPKDVVDRLTQSLTSGDERYSLSIRMRPPQPAAGHAVTPFAIENLDAGKVAILVYDSNFPGQTRAVTVDKVANTWTYEGSSNPAVAPRTYEGDAATQTLALSPMSPGIAVQPCSFCRARAVVPKPAPPAPGRPAPPAQPSPRHAPAVQVGHHGPPTRNADVRVQSKRGVVGKRRGRRVNRLRGARVHDHLHQGGADFDEEPEYSVPAGDAYTVVLDNTTANAAGAEGVHLTGPGYNAEIEGIEQRPGQITTLRVSANGHRVVVRSNRTIATPTISFGLQEDGADHEFALQRKTRLKAGSELVFELDPGSDRLAIDGTDGTYDMVMRYVHTDGERVFAKENLSTAAVTDGGAGEATLSFGGFDGEGGGDLRLSGDGGEHRSLDSDVKPDAEHDEVTEEVVE